MRVFTSQDGKRWVASIHAGEDAAAGVDSRTGWEVIQFDTEPSGSYQKITHRPSGWLNDATIQELIAALQEAESVRASWK
ncbi:MAG TPA: hypothetical protein VF021_07235 [Longimicrobiales bacterium]